MTEPREAQLEAVFKALASQPRRQILALLASGVGDERCCGANEVCACELSDQLGLGAPTISHHMKALVESGLVSSAKRGLWVYYTIETDALHLAMGELQRFAAEPEADGSGEEQADAAGCCCG